VEVDGPDDDTSEDWIVVDDEVTAIKDEDDELFEGIGPPDSATYATAAATTTTTTTIRAMTTGAIPRLDLFKLGIDRLKLII